jgi:hypothetical protein
MSGAKIVLSTLDFCDVEHYSRPDAGRGDGASTTIPTVAVRTPTGI